MNSLPGHGSIFYISVPEEPVKRTISVELEANVVSCNVSEASPLEVAQYAIELYQRGFFCCESVICSIRDLFEVDVPDTVIAMSSAMAVGAGRSGCMCGALNGGILTLGLFFGRTEPDSPEIYRCLSLSHELHDWFREATAKHSVCCRVLTKGFDMDSGAHKPQCHAFTGLIAGKVSEMLCRELGIRNLDPEPIVGLSSPFTPNCIPEHLPFRV